jgi:hypothetical protein
MFFQAYLLCSLLTILLLTQLLDGRWTIQVNVYDALLTEPALTGFLLLHIVITCHAHVEWTSTTVPTLFGSALGEGTCETVFYVVLEYLTN